MEKSGVRKIIFILPYLSRALSEAQRHERIFRERSIVRHSRQLGYECELFLLSYAQSVRRVEDEVGSWLFPVDNPESAKSKSYVSTALLKRLEKEKPDLVVFKGMGYKLCWWLVLRSSHRFRLAFITAGGTSDWLAPWAEFILGETQEQLSVSFADLQRQGRTGILPKLLLPGDFQKSPEKAFDIINVGIFSPNKNQQALVPLFPKCRIALIGDGECYGGIKSLADTYPANVYMPGNLPRARIPSLIAHSRLMVHPARGEGVPRVFMEAFACGVPVLALRRAVPGAFEHGVHGLMVEEEDLVPTALDLLEDDVRLQAMGRRAFEYARDNCSEGAVFAAIERMYEIALAYGRGQHYQSRTYQIVRAKAARQVIIDGMVDAARAFRLNKLKHWLRRRRKGTSWAPL